MTKTNLARGRKADPVARAARRNQILMAALDCFVAKGFHGASTADISAAAGISIAGLYQYFDSKEDLVAAIVEWDTRENLRRVKEVRENPDFLAAIESVLLEMTGNDALGHQRLRMEILCEAGRSERIGQIVAKSDAQIIDSLTDAIIASQERGQIDPTLDPNLVAIALNSMSDGTLARMNLPAEARGRYISASLDFVRRAISLKSP